MLLASVSLPGICYSADSLADLSPVYAAESVFPFNARHNHAPGIAELANGELIVSWYRGSGERSADDVAVFGARRKVGDTGWGETFLMTDTPQSCSSRMISPAMRSARSISCLPYCRFRSRKSRKQKSTKPKANSAKNCINAWAGSHAASQPSCHPAASCCLCTRIRF